jgi:hypothetical protein
MLMPRALAVLRLITSSYLFGACTGRSARFSLLRIFTDNERVEYSEFYGVMCARRPASGARLHGWFSSRGSSRLH